MVELGEGGVNCGAVGGKRTTTNSDFKNRVTNNIHTFNYNFITA
jgi:hypothetical protein